MSALLSNIRRSLVTQGFGISLRLVVSVVLARVLGPQARGEVALALWVPAIFNALFYWGFGEGSVALLHREGVNRRRILGSLNMLSLMAIACGLAGYVAAAPALLGLLRGELSSRLYWLALPLFPVTLIWAGWGFIHLGVGRVMEVNWGRVVNQAVLALLLLGGLSRLRQDAGYAVAAALAAAAVEMAWIGWRLHRQVPMTLVWDAAMARRQLALGSQATVLLWVSLLAQRLDLVLVTWAGGAAGVGFYAVAAALREAALALPETFVRPIIADASRADQRGGIRHLTSVFLLAVAALIALAAALWAIMPWLITRLYSAEFLPSISLARWLLLGFVAVSIQGLLTASLTGLGRLKPVIIAQAVGLSVLLAGARWLATSHGVDGVAMAISAAQWAALLVLVIQLEWRDPGSMRHLLRAGRAA